jgi:hypothetical protein
MFQLGRRNFNNLEEAQQLFGKRFALSSRKYSEAGSSIRLGINR